MATSRTLLPLLLFALATSLAIMAGVYLEGVHGDSTFVHRREAIEAWAAPEAAPETAPEAAPEAGPESAPPPFPTCPANYCTNATIPNCCVNPAGVLFCTDFQNFSETCGSCFGKCAFIGSKPCCSGVCTDQEIDPLNCGSCGNVCGKGCQCVNGICTS